MTLGERCLDALVLLGGTATSAEVCGKLQAGGEQLLTPRQVSVALAHLARQGRPRVAGGAGRRSRLWRLAAEAGGEAA